MKEYNNPKLIASMNKMINGKETACHVYTECEADVREEWGDSTFNRRRHILRILFFQR